MQEDLDINWIDYGWRNFDPSLGRWFGVDNLAEKYVSNSPYHYADNNPILNYDIDGNEFTESAWKYVNRVIKNIDKRQNKNNETIADLQSQIDSGELRKGQVKRKQGRIEKLKGVNQELEGVRGEIATLDGSDQVYDVVFDSGGTKRGAVGNTTTNSTSFNFENGNVEITVSHGSGLDLFAHELLHAYQFEVGELSLGSRKSARAPTFLRDKQDELAGYARARLFGDSNSIINTSDLEGNYRNLPSGPVNIHNISNAVNTAIRTKNNIQLQALAKQRNQAFRVNGKTFTPQNN